MVVPTPDGVSNELVLAAAAVAGVDRVFAVGGAQAVAALAFGTETVPKVDKIVGPGNIYVATAKGMVFGQVGIDMIAGHSEILVVCDGNTDPDWIAMDLFSQAEHDEDAQSILVCPDGQFIEQVLESIDRLLPDMEREPIIATALRERGASAPPPAVSTERTTDAPWYPYPWPPYGSHRPGRPGHRPPLRPDRPSPVDPEPPPLKSPIPGADWSERN